MSLRRPEDILNSLNEMKLVRLNQVVDFIAKELESKYAGIPVDIWADGNKSGYEQIIPQLKERFKEKGWSILIIKSFSNQKDGDRTLFRVEKLK